MSQWENHRYRKTKNRLLKVCYVPGTSTGFLRFLFLMRPLTVLMKQTRQAGHTIKQSILLRCLWSAVYLCLYVYGFKWTFLRCCWPVREVQGRKECRSIRQRNLDSSGPWSCRCVAPSPASSAASVRVGDIGTDGRCRRRPYSRRRPTVVGATELF